jgi:uncharacterized Rmd1/YagE family protein
MDCCAFCTASSYRFKALYESLKGRYKATLFRDVVHIEAYHEEKGAIDLFYFSYGAMICWGASLTESAFYLEEVRDYEEQPLKRMETDDFVFSYGKTMKFVDDEITLPDQELLTKLAMSHGLAQSVKLAAFESSIVEVVEKTRYIPENLAKKGKIPLSRHEIRQKMGELFIERSSINLHVDALDKPELFWDYPELEPLYNMTAKELDIGTRGLVLNKRLDVVKELFEMLGTELNHQHSSRLELTIIWLIIIEVAISLLTTFELL